MSNQSFDKVQRDLHDPLHSVGATITKDYFRVIGNGPGLRPIGIDPLGRIWIEDNGQILTCVLETNPERLQRIKEKQLHAE